MSFRQVLQLLIAAIFVLLAGTASAQTLYTRSVVAKGTFDLDRHYPKGMGVRTPFNFHRMLRTPQNGERINYFVFKPSTDVLKFMKSLSKSDLFSRLEPCSRGIDQALSDRAQTIGGSIKPILGRADLLPYLKRQELIQSDGYVYVAIDSNLRNYVRAPDDFGYEWVAMAVKKQQLCLYMGVGEMGIALLRRYPSM
ncbi:MAG: hypothetical protein E5Y88_24965 [Mesorhizobium sp.]|uniref:hypothetical protein n=1 Tax=unclassified Mesorhizobium TaxID=325217 RepID=UPI000F75E30A|nr:MULTISPECIES: hypothetical protein [unclassified Mesorhizobium]AZO69096.1 hypothetical protein EJ075_32080 [Mesorhizobium sp. M6A.T.Cr.TU.016.01.1.1]RWP41347.1 MAG: hypothetical protein EOR05_31330 [Mesorhizobium sp.]RWP47931.1 MAG: hypothetical protein EOR06_27990 [Mesorhizobium sp.]RWQ31739.1 MAG: hypothetical protein EOS20_29975 [Mesorhizobium sp.]RWQ82126.1 MAG: hypothetical protein EOS85_13370 [Mesorhizobium sp.]